jgi:hypothetical protein
MVKYSTETFIEKAKEVHLSKYDYSKVQYVNSSTKVCVICPLHGEFWVAPYAHLNGVGCPECAGVKKRDTESFIKKAKEVHGDRYDYSKTVYVNKRTKVVITCPIHGDFEQLANNHLRGQGCPLCGKKYASEYKKNDYKHFIQESKNRFGEKYSFPNIEEEYENSHSKITIKCNDCGTEFVKIACDHLTSPNGGCPSCFSHTSKPEDEIYEYISSLIGADKVVKNDYSVINPFEIDIYIPSLKIGFEYNGLYWHSDEYRPSKNYHLEKTEMCEKKGIRLIQIFEDEYLYKKDIVLNKISHLIGNTVQERIYARKCTIGEITYKESSAFLDKFHIQGGAKATVYFGCFNNSNLVGVMTFKKESNNDNKWELNRFATDYNIICCGVGGKMFSYFVKKYNPSEIKSFADRRWSTNILDNLYTKIGFKFDKYTLPDYRYIKGNDKIRYHKFGFRKNILYKKYGADKNLTEQEICSNLGFNKVWDCGLIKYIWRNEQNL